MDKIEISVEFRQKTVAGMAACTASKDVSMDVARDAETIKAVVEYVQKIIKSEVRDVAITFIMRKDYTDTATSRLWYYDRYMGQYNIVKWASVNSTDTYEYDKITAKQIKEMYLECVDRYEGKAA